MTEGTVEVSAADRLERYRGRVEGALGGYSPGHDPTIPEHREKQLASDVSQLEAFAYLAEVSGQKVEDEEMRRLTRIIDQKFERKLVEKRRAMMRENPRLAGYVEEEERGGDEQVR